MEDYELEKELIRDEKNSCGFEFCILGQPPELKEPERK
jgi:hypothetical protein